MIQTIAVIIPVGMICKLKYVPVYLTADKFTIKIPGNKFLF